MKLTLSTRALKACEAVASRDETRYTLCGILIEIPSDSHVILVASDARSLFAMRIRVDVHGFTAPCQYIIPIGLVEMLSPALSGQGMVEVEITEPDSKECPVITLTDYTASDVISYSRRVIIGTYPDWRKVAALIAQQSLLPATDHFLAGQLAGLSRAAEILSNMPVSISLWNAGPMQPMVVKSDWGDNDVFALLMPVLVKGNRVRPEVPEWTKRLPAMEGSPK